MVGAILCSLTLFPIHSGFDHCVLPTLSFFLVLKTKKPRLSFVWLVVSMRRLQQLPVLTLASLPGVILVAAWLRSGSAPKRSPCNGLTVKTPTCSVMPCSASPSSWYKTGRYVYTLESPPCDRVCVCVCVCKVVCIQKGNIPTMGLSDAVCCYRSCLSICQLTIVHHTIVHFHSRCNRPDKTNLWRTEWQREYVTKHEKQYEKHHDKFVPQTQRG